MRLSLQTIRAIRNAKDKTSHELLVEELGRLPHVPGLFQREIVDTLAQINDDEGHGNLASRSWNEGIAIIKWWLTDRGFDKIKTVH